MGLKGDESGLEGKANTEADDDENPDNGGVAGSVVEYESEARATNT
jgi:hypothetical protein